MKKTARPRQSRKKQPDPMLSCADQGALAGETPAPCGGPPVSPCGPAKPDKACRVPPLGQAGVVEHLQDIVRQSVAEGNMQHALKAIELLGKHLGMFRERAADKDEAGPDIHVNLDLGGAAENGQDGSIK